MTEKLPFQTSQNIVKDLYYLYKGMNPSPMFSIKKFYEWLKEFTELNHLGILLAIMEIASYSMHLTYEELLTIEQHPTLPNTYWFSANDGSLRRYMDYEEVISTLKQLESAATYTINEHFIRNFNVWLN